MEGLLKPENLPKLKRILTLHVVPGKIWAKDVGGKKLTPKSVEGEMLNIDGTNGVHVNGASVTTADVECSNGMIHAIDNRADAEELNGQEAHPRLRRTFPPGGKVPAQTADGSLLLEPRQQA